MKNENIDYVICPICKKKLKRINKQHLLAHKLIMKKFRKLFPRQELTCENLKKKCAGYGMLGKRHSEKSKKDIGKSNSIALIGRKQSQETIQKRVKSNTGKKRTQETCKKISKSLTGKIRVRREIRECACGCKQEFECLISSTKKYINLIHYYSEEKSQEIRDKIGNFQKFRKRNSHTEKEKKNLRKIAVKRILLNNGIFPNYNSRACEFFKSFDEKYNTQGQYATSPHEYYIKELGYWPDYINFKEKIIMEWDEKHHEKQKEKDNIRQKEIEKFYPDFKFIRIKQDKVR